MGQLSKKLCAISQPRSVLVGQRPGLNEHDEYMAMFKSVFAWSDIERAVRYFKHKSTGCSPADRLRLNLSLFYSLVESGRRSKCSRDAHRKLMEKIAHELHLDHEVLREACLKNGYLPTYEELFDGTFEMEMIGHYMWETAARELDAQGLSTYIIQKLPMNEELIDKEQYPRFNNIYRVKLFDALMLNVHAMLYNNDGHLIIPMVQFILKEFMDEIDDQSVISLLNLMENTFKRLNDIYGRSIEFDDNALSQFCDNYLQGTPEKLN